MGSTSALIYNLHLNNTSCFKCSSSSGISRTSLITSQRKAAKLKFLSRKESKKFSRIVCCAVEEFNERQPESNSGTGGGLGSAVEDKPDVADVSEENLFQNNEMHDEGNALYNFLYPSKELLPDDNEMSIFDHLEELRQRIFVSVLAVGGAILGCFAYSKELIMVLEAPVSAQGVRFLQLAPGEFFFTTLKVSGYCGLLLGSPVILYEIIAFVIPGLTRAERRFLGPIVLGSSVLFYSENLRDRLTQTGILAKRKISSMDGPNRRARGDNPSTETTMQAGFSRGPVPPATSGPTRRDTFRQRKPNTSRPPSMHVDDYVARERNADGTINPNVIAVPRIGSSSGRPPSIHVDEFMARQRDRQPPVGMAVSDATAHLKSAPPENISDAEKFSKSRQTKPDLDDDLQGIDIVFDAEEADLDDKLPFPQPDDNLPPPTSVAVEQNSPHSIVEETESDANENSQFSHLNTPLASNMDENTPSEFSSRMSVSLYEKLLTREPSVSSEKKFPDQSDESKSLMIKSSAGLDSAPGASSSGFSASVYGNVNTASAEGHVDSRTRHNLYPKAGAQHGATAPSAVGSQGFLDQKFQPNPPPLPPLPPPQTVSLFSQNADPIVSQSSPFVTSTVDVQPLIPPGFHVQGEYFSPHTSSSGVLTSSSPLPDTNYGRTSLSSPGGSASGSARPHPPLPPTPRPHLANPSLSKNMSSQSLLYNQNIIGTVERQQSSVASSSDVRLSNLPSSGTMITSYSPTSLVPPMLFGRPGSVPVGLYGSGQSPHHGENLSSISQNIPISLPSMHSLPSLGQLQPLQPPQLPRPAVQHLRPLVPASPQPEQAGSFLQSPLQMQVQMQMQPLQMLQQPQVSPAHIYYQTPQSENVLHTLQQQQVEHSQAQALRLQGDGTSQQQDPGMTLQEYFRSPEAIQSLLSDRDKLCQLLEQHPKLMQMLQERLGQL